MSFWVVGGGRLDAHGNGPYMENGKRRVSFSDDYNDHGFYQIPKRPRLDPWGHAVPSQYHHHDHDHDHDHDGSFLGHSVRIKDLAFLVIRESSPTPEPPTVADTLHMERTESGLSISSDNAHHSCLEDEEPMLGDFEAANLVRAHVASFRRRYPDSKHGRILKALINPKSREADFPLDNDALRSIFIAANEIFFANRLAQRVTWDWSHATSAQYESHIVGTTALRRCARLGGYETLIVLSSPILKDTQYNRRLLISTFLHEMIHSFLFVVCGVKARLCGGHTEGFRQIAEIIDNWVGADYLHLRSMEADLERFKGHNFPAYETSPRGLLVRRVWEEDDMYAQPLQHVPRDYGDQRWEWCEHEGFVA
ncbi:hypothetical protein S40288_06915 [Stachybotrys chartarum IBT 40288]|nr:hypothetical protein S40288_06915 [Stachybotrys chartarum IBT 40288]